MTHSLDCHLSGFSRSFLLVPPGLGFSEHRLPRLHRVNDLSPGFLCPPGGEKAVRTCRVSGFGAGQEGEKGQPAPFPLRVDSKEHGQGPALPRGPPGLRGHCCPSLNAPRLLWALFHSVNVNVLFTPLLCPADSCCFFRVCRPSSGKHPCTPAG